MKHYLFLLLVIPCLIGCSGTAQPTNDQINTVIGDISYQQKFSRRPDKNTDENTRIKTHLAYVETLLRKRDVSHWPIAAKAKRSELLNLLHEYCVAGKFPANYDHPEERRPCFIDRNGNICAVGYLVEQTAGRAVAEKINEQHQYDRIAEMKAPELLAWVENSGLTKEECAMIQPNYGPAKYNVNDISPANSIATGAWSGLNLSLIAINTIQLCNNTTSSRLFPLAGMISGAGQVAYGILTIPQDKNGWSGIVTNNAQKNVSIINIGVGATSLFLSGINYFYPKQRSSKNSYGIQNFSTPRGNDNVALVYTRRL